MFVSIITVNYNGKTLLKRFLDSVFAIDYPKEKYEVIVVDNGSSDGSKKFIRNYYGEVKLIESKKNLGFGGGNNLGIDNSRGDLFFLINNDTYIPKDTVKNAVECYKNNRKDNVGVITSKLVLIDKYLEVVLEGAGFSDFSIEKKASKPINAKPFIRNYMQDKSFSQQVLLPFNHLVKDELEIKITISKSDDQKYKIYLGGRSFKDGKFGKKEEKKKISIKLKENEIDCLTNDLIQNAGNYYFRDGAGRDRGVYIVGNKQYYEIDKGQYNEEEYVPGFNGAGVFLSRKLIEDVGFFDDKFFMYYEDGDLSHRLRKKGWKIRYCPQALIRHIHSASSVEWSDFFIYHTERNRLLMIFKHWPLPTVLWLWFIYVVKETLGTTLYYLIKGEYAIALRRFKTRLRINFSLLGNFFRFLMISERYTNKEIRTFL